MNKEDLHSLIAEGSGNAGNICQICALIDGVTVYEDCWRGFSSHDAVNIMSVTKGVMSLITGIAVDKGYIRNVDQKVLDELLTHEEFVKAYDENFPPEQFQHYGAFLATMYQFLGGYDSLIQLVRNYMVV